MIAKGWRYRLRSILFLLIFWGCAYWGYTYLGRGRGLGFVVGLGLVGLLLLMLSIPASDLLAKLLTRHFVQRGRPDLALKWLAPLDRYNPSASVDLARATALLSSGRAAEAEPLLVGCLKNPASTNRLKQAAAVQLAAALREQGRDINTEDLIKTGNSGAHTQ